MRVNLPVLPEVSDDLLTGHLEAHTRLDEGLTVAYPDVARLLTRFANRMSVASISNIRPSIRGGSRPQLFPAPRSFLSRADRARIAGTAAAYRHVDSRLAMVREGHDSPPALRPETPYVLHALSEGRVDNPLETNPGMIRGVEYPDDHLPVAPYPPPPRDSCRELLEGAIELAIGDGAPEAVKAAWLLFTIGEIHPFQDGNGRVARLLHLLVAGEGLPRTVDWGVSEQLRFHEERFRESLRHRDPEPAVFTVVELSRQGASLMSDRLAAIGVIVPELARRLGVAIDMAVLVTATWLRRLGALDELAVDVGRPYLDTLQCAQSLLELGIFERRPSTSGEARAAPPVYALSPTGTAELAPVVAMLERS